MTPLDMTPLYRKLTTPTSQSGTHLQCCELWQQTLEKILASELVGLIL